MIDLVIYGLFLAIGAVSYAYMLYAKNDGGYIFGAFASVLLMFTGLMLLTDGVSYTTGYQLNQTDILSHELFNITHFDQPAPQTGENETLYLHVNTSITIDQTATFTTVKNAYTDTLGLMMFLVGAFILLVLVSIFTDRKANPDYEVN